MGNQSATLHSMQPMQFRTLGIYESKKNNAIICLVRCKAGDTEIFKSHEIDIPLNEDTPNRPLIIYVLSKTKIQQHQSYFSCKPKATIFNIQKTAEMGAPLSPEPLYLSDYTYEQECIHDINEIIADQFEFQAKLIYDEHGVENFTEFFYTLARDQRFKLDILLDRIEKNVQTEAEHYIYLALQFQKQEIRRLCMEYHLENPAMEAINDALGLAAIPMPSSRLLPKDLHPEVAAILPAPQGEEVKPRPYINPMTFFAAGLAILLSSKFIHKQMDGP